MNTNLWRYTVSIVFGEYKYKDIQYQYRAEGDTEWTTMAGNYFETDSQDNYEIRVINSEQEEIMTLIPQ